ncbi:MAG TPA: hypothetical protein VF824_05265 [Thermoanaerobaculia bacterium]|jgi:hypothetical protein
MGEYFVPLKTLVPAAAGLPLDAVPLLGPLYNAALEHAGVRDWRESWSDTHVSIDGEAALDAAMEIPLGGGADGAALVAGASGGGLTALKFQLSYARRSALKAAIEEKITPLVGTAAKEEDVDLDPPVQVFAQMDVIPTRFRLVISGAGLSIRLPKSVRRGKTQMDGAEIAAIVPADDADQSVYIALPSAVLTIDTETGVDVRLADDQALELPPCLIGDSGLGLLANDVKVDFSRTTGFAEVLARPGYDETWVGVYIAELAIFNLNKVLPCLSNLPRRIEATKWIIGTDGISGALDVEALPAGDANAAWQALDLGIEFDRGSLVRGTIGSIIHAGTIANDFVSLGPAGDLKVLFSLRHNPNLPGNDAWGWEVALLTPGSKDAGLLRFKNAALKRLFVAMPVLAAIALGADAQFSSSDTLIVLLFALFAKLELDDKIVFESITIETLRFRWFADGTAPVVRYLDIVFDIQTRISIHNLNLVLLTLDTSRPIGVDMKGLTLRWALDLDDLPDDVKKTIPKFQFIWDSNGGITFDFAEQALIKDSFLEIVKLGGGKWEKGAWLDVGVRTTQKLTDAGAAGAAARLFFLTDGTHDHTELEGLEITMLVPEAIYCHASLGWGKEKEVWAHAMVIGNGSASLMPIDPTDPMGKLRAYTMRSSWMYDIEVYMRWGKIEGTDVTSLVAQASLSFSTGIPLGSTGASVFGFLGQVANNAVPDPPNGDWRAWFMDLDPKNSVIGPKWTDCEGAVGLGFGAIFGSTLDLGRTWNGKVGLLILVPGPIIVVAGTFSLLEARPSLGDDKSAKFIGLIVLDPTRKTLTVAVTVNFNIPDPSGKIVKISVPTEIFVDWSKEHRRFHLYIGKHWPLSERASAVALGIFNISGYLMFDSEDIENLANSGINVPAFAIAHGGRAEWQKGLKSGKIKCYFYVRVEYNLAVGMPDPWLLFGELEIAGGLVVKVFGFGFEFGVWARLTAIAPDPFEIKGEVGVHIDLPWPLPDIDHSVPLTLVSEQSDPPKLQEIVGELSLHPANANQPITWAQGTAAPQDVPLDPSLTLSFRFPIRNETAQIGSFNFDSVDLETTHWTSGGKGYVLRLVDLTLTNCKTNAVLTKIPAIWRPEGAPAAGGAKARMSLDLFAFKSLTTSRYIGTAAEYIDTITKTWDPCAPPKKASLVPYTFKNQPPGPFQQLVLQRKGEPDVLAKALPAPPNADMLQKLFGLATSPPGVVAWPGDGSFSACVLPLTAGAWTKALPQLFATQPLSLEFERAGDVLFACIRPATRGPSITAKFYDGDTLVETSHGLSGGTQGPWEVVLFAHQKPVTRLELTSTIESLSIDGPPIIPFAYLMIFWLRYEAAVIKQVQDEESAKAWSQLWSDLLDQQAATSDALLLDCETTYRLSGKVQWNAVKGVEPEGGSFEESFWFDFHTRKEREKCPLVKRHPNLGAADDRWEIETLPGDGTYAMYRTRPVRLTFRDPRIEAVFAKFGEQMILRLIDDQGKDLFDTLEIIAADPHSLAEYEAVWKAKVEESQCAPTGIDTLWSMGIASFPTLLKPSREYKASVYALPSSISDFSNVDWAKWDIVHDFKFRTSRWNGLFEHVDAHTLYDDVVTKVPDFASILALLPPDGSPLRDDQLLDAILFDWLGYSIKGIPLDPEAVLLWRKNKDGVMVAVGLLLDGPEPLLREAGSSFGLSVEGGPAGFRLLSGASATRSLLLFTKAGQYAAAKPGAYTLTIVDAFVDMNGNAASESHSMFIAIGDQPAALQQEPAP